MRVVGFLSYSGPSQQRLGAWAAEWRRGAALFSFFFLPPPSGCFHSSWMSVILGIVPPWTVEETPKSSRAPEGICLWQTTSPVRGTKPMDQWVPLIKKKKKCKKGGEGVILPTSWSFWLLLFVSAFLKVKEKVMLQVIYLLLHQNKHVSPLSDYRVLKGIYSRVEQ